MHATRAFGTIAVVAATALFAAGCGSSSNSGSSSGSGDSSTAKVAQGGTFTAYDASFPDYLDPALSFTSDGVDSLWVTYTGLLTFRHATGEAGSQVVPGLATALPKITNDGKTYSLTLRGGLKYSDGSPIKASDFTHSIQRVLNLESGGATFYEGIKGAIAYEKAGKANGPLSGIQTDDATGAITINLVEADPQFSYKLAMTFAGLVPGDTPFQNETKNPPPASGQFMLEDVKSNQAWSLVRNPHFTPSPNLPVAKADRINWKIVHNQLTQANDLVANKVDYIYNPSQPDALQILRNGAKGRFATPAINATYWLFLNTKIAPFNNLQARQAINMAIDKGAIARLYAGLIQPTCNYLPPGIVGYKPLNPCPYGTPGAKPNLAKAKALVQQSGTAGQTIKVFSDTDDPTPEVMQYVTDVLNSIGYKAKLKTVDSADYFATVGNATTGAQIGFSNWSQDYPHASDFFQLVLSSSIQATNNENFSNVNDPKLDAAIHKANSAIDPRTVANQYAAIDKYVVDQGYTANYGDKKLAYATSSRVAFNQFLFHPVYDADLTTLGTSAK
jgi:peptide/nickel transport system substrate-binding protein